MLFVIHYMTIYIDLAALGTFFDLVQVEMVQMQMRFRHLIQPPMPIAFEST